LKHQPSFSICIPNYNYGHYIAETIQSILNQTYQNFEIIVADNASTDNSIEVIKSFDDPRIRLIRNQYNIGFAPNLQHATMHAENDFLNLLSSDDLMKPNALETYANLIMEMQEQADNLVLISDVDIVDSKSQIIGEIICGSPTILPFGATSSFNGKTYLTYSGLSVLHNALKQLRTFAPFLSVVYPRALWEAVEGYNSVRAIGPDKHFHYKLLSLNPDVIYVRSPLFSYRQHSSPNQKAQQTNLKQQIDDYMYTLEYSDEFLSEINLTRRELIRVLLDRVCLKTGLTQLANGRYQQAFRMLAFALAAYPKETFSRPRAYMLAGLLAFGPFARIIARPFYNLYHKKELERIANERLETPA